MVPSIHIYHILHILLHVPCDICACFYPCHQELLDLCVLPNMTCMASVFCHVLLQITYNILFVVTFVALTFLASMFHNMVRQFKFGFCLEVTFITLTCMAFVFCHMFLQITCGFCVFATWFSR